MQEKLIYIVGEDNVFVDEPMSRHTTFKVGGPADYLVTPHTVEEIKDIIKSCRETNTNYYIIGNGSNLLVKDSGLRGVVIQLYKNFSDYTVEGNRITAKSGIMLSALKVPVIENEFAGYEFASGIPGTLGGAVYMNAGAYGGQMKDIIVSVKALDEEGNVITLTKDELNFSYRHSEVMDKGYIVLEATMEFGKGDARRIKAKMSELAHQRQSKQPLEYPSAGSTFKRPEGYFAGKLIMDSNLAGYTVGGAKVSDKHCGFVVNTGNATASDILCLIKDVQDKVMEKYGVKLETEVKILGD